VRRRADSQAAARGRMVEDQLRRRGVRDAAVLEAMAAVPREEFVGRGQAGFAYDDSALPIAAGQTISQPYVVALMVEALDLRPDDRVLEVGAGSGYAAAVMSRICRRVHGVERHAELVESARAALERLGYDNVELRHADGTLGLPAAAPFDAILVSAGGPAIPAALRGQLAVGGRLVMPVGSSGQMQRLVRARRDADDEWREDDLGPVAFVPLVGAQGWRDEEG
jgi:protein-L-isoaspartate(D-aspartate) O-methyltransferase